MIKITNIFISEIGHLFNEQQLNSSYEVFEKNDIINLSGFNLHIDFEREVFYYGETYLWKEWASTF